MGLLSVSALAQNSQTVAIALEKGLGEENLPVFNGVRFYDALRSTQDNFRYYGQYRPYDATINYNGIDYHNIKTRYDLRSDHLIVYSPGEISFFQVKLSNEKIKSFQLGKTFFINVDLSKKYNKNPQAFYKLTFQGNDLRLLTSWKKGEKLQSKNGTPFYTFKTSLEFFILKESQYHQVDSRRDMVQLFPELNNEIRDFYRSFRSLARKKPEKFMNDLVFYIDQASRKKRIK